MSGERVVHVKKEQYTVYIGRAVPSARLRASVWANHFKIGRDGTRDQVIDKYRRYILGYPTLLEKLPELRGQVLGCWCAPDRCHGDVLLELLNGVPLHNVNA